MKFLSKEITNDINPAKFLNNLKIDHQIGLHAFNKVYGGGNIKIPAGTIIEIMNLAKLVEILLAEKRIEEVETALQQQLEIINQAKLENNKHLKKLLLPEIKHFFKNYLNHRKFERHNILKGKKKKDFIEIEKKVIDFFNNYDGNLFKFISDIVENDLGVNREAAPKFKGLYKVLWENGEVFKCNVNPGIFNSYYDTTLHGVIYNNEKFTSEKHFKAFLKELHIHNGQDKQGKDLKSPNIGNMMSLLEDIIKK